MVQFITTPGSTWKEVERKFKGFKGGMLAPTCVSGSPVNLSRVCVTGGERGKEALTFLFSTAKDRGFSTTEYQTFVTGIRKALPRSVVEIIQSVEISLCVEI